MEVIKLPKKFRMVCYEIMDGKEEALTALETFADKYPHQVAAIKAEVAYFNLDYETALNLDLTVLPWLEEWYYSNVSDIFEIAAWFGIAGTDRGADEGTGAYPV